ncbi:hypothetical protein STCU_06462 [Strigomonas culicis]|uniref:Nodulin-like domain-containing protein n=1 Tax=Strigomonas culicis TaxID=28005 RepID=S9U4U2_9TRYP|nr:hypothetical protein STCU_06462 [Strigomonas culicis]|eukprot:EPY25817.1 hypothetical protein STCU_06462 [Strigomonas culicis]
MSHLSLEEKAERERTKAQYLAQKPPMWRFIWGFTLIGFFTICLPVQSVITAFANVNRTAEIIFAVIAAFGVFVFAGMCLPWTACCGKSRRNSNGDVAGEGGDVSDLPDMENVDEQVAEIELNVTGKHEPHGEGVDRNDTSSSAGTAVTARRSLVTDLDYIAPQYHRSFFQNLLTTELWSIFWSLFVIIGAELVIIFNATYVLGALMGKSPSSEVRTLLTVVNGTGSAIGRIIMSAFEVYTQNRKAEDRIPITISLFPPTCSVILALILFLVLPGNLSLLLPFVLIALGNGFINAAVVLTTRTIYAKDNAKHYNFCYLAMCCASIVFVRALYGEWYSNQAEKNGDSRVCYGRSCVQTPIIILTCLSATAFATNVYSHLRYRAFSIRTLRARAEMRGEIECNGAGPVSNAKGVAFSAEPIDEHKDTKDIRV